MLIEIEKTFDEMEDVHRIAVETLLLVHFRIDIRGDGTKMIVEIECHETDAVL